MIQPIFEILNQRGTPMFFSDIFSNRPAAGIVGRIFISTDTRLIYRDTGTTWELLGNTGTVSSVGLSMPVAFNVANSPITGSGTLEVTAAGTISQYVRGDGTLGDFPNVSGGGSSVSYYLNGGTNQGTFGGNTYYQMSKTPVNSTAANFTRSTDGYIAEFITNAGDPALLNIPAGNWNTQTYFSSNSTGGSPSFYVELYKYDGTTFTLIASGSATPEIITNGTNIDVYYTSLAVPATTLTLTDRLAIRYYVTTTGRTLTMYTQDNHLAQIITTFTSGITAINTQTEQVQFLTTGTSGTDFAINSASGTHTFNLPVASSTKTGKLSSTDWTTFNSKQNALTFGNLTESTSTALTITGGTGAVIGSGTTIEVKSASASQNGIVTTGTQTFAGIKTFSDAITLGESSGDNQTLINFPAGSSLIYRENAGSFYGFNIEPVVDNSFFWLNQEGGYYQALYYGDSSGGAYNIFGISQSNNAGTSWNPLFVINANGTIGINKNNPTAALDVTGAGVFSSTLTASISALSTPSNAFVVSDSGTLKYRTAAQVLSDIGGQPAISNPVTGTGVANQITYWDSTSSIAALSTATYPSLTELSYVKGVTSSIQTQLNGKQASGNYVTTDTIQTISAKKTFSIQTDFSAAINLLNNQALYLYNSGSTFATGLFSSATLSANRTIYFPNAGGTVALTSDLSAYLPLTGGTLTGALYGKQANFTFDADGDNILNLTNNHSGAYTYNAGGLYIAATNAVTATNLANGSGAFIIKNGATQTATILYNGSAYFASNVGIGTSSPNAKLEIASANTAIDSRGNLFVSVTDALAADVGGQITMGGAYTSGGALYAFGGIAARKDNATTANVAGYLQLMTTTSAGALTERLRITSGGNVGIGVTPSAWGSGYLGFQFGIAGSQMTYSNNHFVGVNYYFDGTNYKAIQTGTASRIEFGGDTIEIKNAASVSANANQTFNTRLTIASTGVSTFYNDVNIQGATTTNLNVKGGTVDDTGFLNFYTSSTYKSGISGSTSGDIFFYVNGTLTKKHQFLANGNVNFGTGDYANGLTINGGAGPQLVINTTTQFSQISFYNSGTAKSLIAHDNTNVRLLLQNSSGGVYLSSGATSWTANSDETLKNINFIIENAIEKILTLRAVNYHWKDDINKKENIGLIAQDVEKVFPQIIDKDDKGILGVRYSELIPVIIKSIQEIYSEIQALKN